MIKFFLSFQFLIFFFFNAFSQTNNQITYIANEGVFIEYEGKKIIIDALHKKYDAIYQFTRLPYVLAMLEAKTPFDSINLMLVTHVHGDHFNREYTLDLLNKHHETIFIAPQQVIDTMGQLNYLQNKIYAVQGSDKGLMYEMEGLKIHSIPLLHSYQERNHWVENMAYLLDFEGLTILHIGDAELVVDNFDRIKKAIGKGVDYALLPDWYFSEGDHLSKIKQKIKAKKYIAIHVMDTKSGLYERRLKKKVKPFGIDLNVFLRVGETQVLEK